MIKEFKAWFEHKFNPHCSHCAIEKMDKLVCPSCEMLKTQLALANEEKRLMLEALISPTTSHNREAIDDSMAGKMIASPRHVPWSIKRQHLQREDRAAALALQKNQKEDAEARKLAENLKSVAEVKTQSIEELETELGLVDEDSRPEPEELENAG